jgi:hypothetical protein
MPYSQAFIFGADAHAGRLARRTPEGVEHGHKGFVVVLEIRTGEYDELDADSVEHAGRLAEMWVDNRMAQTASIQKVNADGSLTYLGLVSPKEQGEA